jgi:hypothetical protein
MQLRWKGRLYKGQSQSTLSTFPARVPGENPNPRLFSRECFESGTRIEPMHDDLREIKGTRSEK